MAKDNKYLPYLEALAFVSNLGIKNKDEWDIYCKSGNKPENIPSSPSVIYHKQGWANYHIWLGDKDCRYLTYEEAKAYAQTTGIKTSIDWRFNANHPEGIVKEPQTFYKASGWVSWAEFLNSDKVSNSKRNDYFLPYNEARDYVHTLNLLGHKEWVEYCKSGKRPNFIPTMPYKHYKDNGWVDWFDWLNINTQRDKKFVTYDEASTYARENKINSKKEWVEYCKLTDTPSYLPAAADIIYADSGWVDWASFLNGEVLSYEEARAYIHKKRFTNVQAVKDLINSKERPSFIPALPNLYYKDKGWTSWKDFTGGFGVYCSYEEAREYALSLNLRNKKEWVAYHSINRHPLTISLSPNKVYKGKGWTGWLDFLRNHPKEPLIKGRFLSYEKAHNYVKSLNLKGVKGWREHTKTSDFPYNIPKNPDRVYERKGWVSWKVFLGSEFATIDKLRTIMREFNITKVNEYHRLRKLRPDLRIPSNPVSRLFIDVKLGE
jgi:hypothetical protein